MKIKSFKLYFSLFKVTFFVSCFSFGGGYVIIPLLRKYLVEDMKLINNEELLDMAAIAQSNPGAIAVNLSSLIGYNLLGIKGAIITCIGTVLPPLLILSVISFFYEAFRSNMIISAVLKGMEAGVAATIVDLVIDMSGDVFKEKNLLLSLLVPLSFIASFFFNINVLAIIILGVIVSLTQVYVKKKKLGGIRND